MAGLILLSLPTEARSFVSQDAGSTLSVPLSSFGLCLSRCRCTVNESPGLPQEAPGCHRLEITGCSDSVNCGQCGDVMVV